MYEPFVQIIITHTINNTFVLVYFCNYLFSFLSIFMNFSTTFQSSFYVVNIFCFCSSLHVGVQLRRWEVFLLHARLLSSFDTVIFLMHQKLLFTYITTSECLHNISTSSFVDCNGTRGLIILLIIKICQ